MIELENFLPQNALTELLANNKLTDFITQCNNVDSVEYPGISTNIPMPIGQLISMKLSSIMGRPIQKQTMFMRLSLAGVDAPHAAHTDNSMGEYSFMLYLTDNEYCKGGTSFLQHKATLSTSAYSTKIMEAFEDTNNHEAWKVVHTCNMKQNKGLLFESALVHRAEPTNGFGQSLQDGRLVLTCFFS